MLERFWVPMLSLIAEVSMVVLPIFDAELANSPALSSKAKSCQDDMDKIDRRLALLAMEQEMFRPSYLHVTSTTILGGRGSSTVNIFIAKRLMAVPGKSKSEVHEKPFEWKTERQTPGTVCLGRRSFLQNFGIPQLIPILAFSG